MWRAAPRFAQRRRQSARAPHILERHIIRGAQCWLLGLPQWRRCARHAACCHRRWRHDAGNRANRVRNDTISDLARRHCGRVCFAGYTRWLSSRSCDGAPRSAFPCLAATVRLPRRRLHRWHSMDAIDHLNRAPPARFKRGSRQRSSISSHSPSASEMILRHPSLQLSG